MALFDTVLALFGTVLTMLRLLVTRDRGLNGSYIQ